MKEEEDGLKEVKGIWNGVLLSIGLWIMLIIIFFLILMIIN